MWAKKKREIVWRSRELQAIKTGAFAGEWFWYHDREFLTKIQIYTKTYLHEIFDWKNAAASLVKKFEMKKQTHSLLIPKLNVVGNENFRSAFPGLSQTVEHLYSELNILSSLSVITMAR